MRKTNRIFLVSVLVIGIVFSFSSLAFVHAWESRHVLQSPFKHDDKNCNNKLTQVEFRASEHAFQRIDKNDDGFITLVVAGRASPGDQGHRYYQRDHQQPYQGFNKPFLLYAALAFPSKGLNRNEADFQCYLPGKPH